MKNEVLLHKRSSSFSKSWITVLKNAEIQLKKPCYHNNGNLYAYAANNPVKYTDPDGRICYSYYDYEKNNYGITTYSIGGSKVLNISYSILDFYPFKIGEIGKRALEFLESGCCNNLRVIETSRSKNYILNDITNSGIEKYGRFNDAVNLVSLIANAINSGSKNSEILGKTNSLVGAISNYIISPALLGLSVIDEYSAIIDNFIVDVFGNNMYSSTQEGVENKYNLVKDTVMQSLKTGNLEIIYRKNQNYIEYKINNTEIFYNLVNKLNEME